MYKLRYPLSELNIYGLCINDSVEANNIIFNEYVKNPDIGSDIIYWSALCRSVPPIICKMIKQEYIKNHKSSKLDWYYLFNNPSPIIHDIIDQEYTRSRELTYNVYGFSGWLYVCEQSSSIIAKIIEREYMIDNNSPYLVWDSLCINLSPIIVSIIELE